MSLSIVRKSYRRWPDAIYLMNAKAQVVIIPSGGRIMRYSPSAEGPNLLWENPLADPTTDPYLNGWHNPGGDKAWLWPDGEWGKITGTKFPPLWEMDGADYEITVTDETVRLTSPPLPHFGSRIIREIQLDDDSAALQTINRLEPVEGMTPVDVPLAIWTVSQVPVTERVTALIEPGSEVREMSRGHLTAEVAGMAAVLRRDPAHTCKVGLDATAFRVEQEGLAFTQRLVGASDGEWGQGTRAQFYVEKDHSMRSAYMELEFTSPRAIASANGPWVAVRWEIL
jgi:hypothetical protein